MISAKVNFKLDKCNQFGYVINIIKSFKRKSLENFYKTGSTKGIPAEHAQRFCLILNRLNLVIELQDLDVSSFKLYPLKGDMKTKLD